jgi:DNA primase
MAKEDPRIAINMEAAMPYIDFAALKEAVSIEDAVQMLGLQVAKSANQLRGPCPFCKTGGDRALAITPAKNLFYCFGSQSGGDQIQLVAHVRNCKLPEAAELLGKGTVQATVQNSTVSKEHPTAPQRPEAANPSGLTPLDYLDAAHPAVEAAGFNQEEARTLGIGFANKGLMRGTVAVPIRDESGKLLGYIGVTEARLPPKGLLNTNVVKFQKTG